MKHLEVAHPQQVVAEARAQAERAQVGQPVAGNDCHTRSVSSPAVQQPRNTSNAPSQPSLSWIAVTPRASPRACPRAHASTISSIVGRTCGPGTPSRRSRAGSRWARRPRRARPRRPARPAPRVRPAERRAVQPERVVVLRHQRHRHVRRPRGRAPPASAARSSRPSRQPRPRSQRPGRHATRALGHRSLERLARASARPPAAPGSRPSDQVGKCTCAS